MKVLFLTADNVYLTPYLNTYLEILKSKKMDYHVIYWDKNENEELNNPKYTRFSYRKGKYRLFDKINGYRNFKNTIERILTSQRFDYVICLQSVVAVLINNTLVNYYKKKYIVDIRDYSFEWCWLYRYIEKCLIDNSLLNIISSPGYKNFLPLGEYYVLHNIPNDISIYKSQSRKCKDKIVISYIGLVRFMEQNKKIINFFANDNRFELRFIGTNAMMLEQYCKENGISNVALSDTFSPDKISDIYNETDIVMNLYGNNTPLLDYAISNKLYFSAIFRKPILVCKDTCMEALSVGYGFGYSMKLEDFRERDNLYKYIKNLNVDSFNVNCSKFLNDVCKEHRVSIEKIKEVLSNDRCSFREKL